MSNYLNFSFSFLAVFIFLFASFKKLRPEYEKKEIAAAGTSGLILGFVLWFLLKKINLGLLGIILAFWLVLRRFAKKYDWYFWTIAESLSPLAIWVFFLSLLSNIVLKLNWLNLAKVLSMIILIILQIPLGNYRRFRWYKSGKAGFLFLADLSLLSFINSALDFYQKRLLQSLVWLTLMAAGAVGIIILGKERKQVKVSN